MAQKRCTNCGGKFGLIRYRRSYHSFCTKRCREEWDARYIRYMSEHKRWVAYLARGST